MKDCGSFCRLTCVAVGSIQYSMYAVEFSSSPLSGVGNPSAPHRENALSATNRDLHAFGSRCLKYTAKPYLVGDR